MLELVHQDALAGTGWRRLARAALTVEQAPVRARVALRGDLADGGRAAAVAAAIGAAPPAAFFRVVGHDPCILRTAPDRWLVLSRGHDPAGLMAALSGVGAHAIDLSDAAVTLAIAGPGAEDLLRMGCGLDVGAAAFPPLHAALTRFADLRVLLHRLADGAFHLQVDRAHAAWLMRWIEDRSGAG
jgi:heterotetrameric sarcosine oxidase gamma subunit